MANREKGEIGIEIAGTTYTLSMGMNGMAALEELFSREGKDVTFQEVLRRVNAGSLRYQRAFIWAAFHQHHPDLTVDQVGELIDAAGGIFAFASTLVRLAGGTIPNPEDLRTLGVKPGEPGKPGPRKAQARTADGTGTASTVTPAASA